MTGFHNYEKRQPREGKGRKRREPERGGGDLKKKDFQGLLPVDQKSQ